MNNTDMINYETILKIVSSWPTDQRLILVQDVLKTLIPAPAPQPYRNTYEQARGLLATDRPAPTDAEVEQWLEEQRLEKYG